MANPGFDYTRPIGLVTLSTTNIRHAVSITGSSPGPHRLSRLPYRKYRDSDNRVARLNLPNMAGTTSDEKLEAFAAAVRGLQALEPEPERRLK